MGVSKLCFVVVQCRLLTKVGFGAFGTTDRVSIPVAKISSDCLSSSVKLHYCVMKSPDLAGSFHRKTAIFRSTLFVLAGKRHR